MLKLLNKEHKDFSDEFLVLMAIVGYCVYGAQLVINKCARTCDLHGLKDCFFQEKKKYVNNCADAFDRLVTNLEVFDTWFDKIQRGRKDYLSYIHQNANDLVKLLCSTIHGPRTTPKSASAYSELSRASPDRAGSIRQGC